MTFVRTPLHSALGLASIFATLAGCLPADRSPRASDGEMDPSAGATSMDTMEPTDGDDSSEQELLGFDPEVVLARAENYQNELVKVNRDPEPGTHGDAAQINFYSAPGNLELFKTIDPEMPTQTVNFVEGAMFLKEHLDPGGQVIGYTVMYKAKPGYNPDANDWWWARISEGRLTHSGVVNFCVDCHRERAAGTDYVLGVDVANQL